MVDRHGLALRVGDRVQIVGAVIQAIEEELVVVSLPHSIHQDWTRCAPEYVEALPNRVANFGPGSDAPPVMWPNKPLDPPAPKA